MTQRQENSATEAEELQDTLLDAALSHVAFEGWSEATFEAAVADSGVNAGLASALFPRRSIDLAASYHRRGDAMMLKKLAEASLSDLRFRDKIATAVRFRLEAVSDKEAVRRGMALFALPHHAAEGTRLVWGTADAIWTALGDRSEDVNWYTKRASLSAVYSSTVLFWLGDDSPNQQATWEFLDRRIENVMQFETFKASVNKSPVLKPLLAGPNWLLNQIRAPKSRTDLPGRWRPRADG